MVVGAGPVKTAQKSSSKRRMETMLLIRAAT
jgi:hypothetical protein